MDDEKSPFFNICYEQICDQYYYGLFGDFKLIIDTNTGYFNATKLCADGGKYLFHWLRNKESKALIKYLCENSDRVHSDDQFFKTVKGAKDNVYNKIISGTYLPKELILSIAIWISKDFYVKVYSIVENYFVREFNENYEKDAKRLKDRVDQIEHENERLRSELVESEHRSDRLELENDGLRIEKTLLDTMTRKYRIQIERFRNDVAPKTDRDDTLNALVVVEKKNDDEKHPYYAVRCQRRAFARTMRNLKKRFPNCKVVYEISYNPNAVNLYNRMKERLRYVQSRSNHFNVKDFDRFKRDVEKLIPKLDASGPL